MGRERNSRKSSNGKRSSEPGAQSPGVRTSDPLPLTIPNIPSNNDPSISASSVPGILNFNETVPDFVSRVLDIKFYSTPESPRSEPETFPFCPAGNETMKQEDEYARVNDLLKELIQGYTTKDKWNSVKFQDGLAEDRRTSAISKLIKICGPKVPRCELKDYDNQFPSIKWDAGSETKSETNYNNPDIQDDYWAKIFDRPFRGVTQSAFAAVLENEINDEIRRCKCAAPVYELTKVYQELCNGTLTVDNMNMTDIMIDDYLSVRDSMEEPQEKLFARLKVYKRAMCSLMYHFKTLRPILKDIKTSYDGVVGLRERQMHDILLLKNNIGFTERKFDTKMSDVRREGFYQMCEAEKRCFLLLRHVDKQDAAIRTMTEILNCLEKALEEEKSLKTISEDQRKKLIMEINDLRRQMSESTRVMVQDAALQAAAAAVEKDSLDEVTAEEDLASVNDSAILRNAVENTRKSLSEAQQRLTILEADYSDVVPKKDYEVLEDKMKVASDKHKVVKDEYETLSTQFQGIKDQIDQLIAERDDYQELVLDLKFKSTPRPSWSKIAEFVEGGLPRWQEIYQGKSSKQIVDHVVEILTGKKPKGPADTFASKGTSEKVAPYLRYDEGAQIPQRNLTRREAAILIHDVQQTRIDQLEVLRKRRDSAEEDFSYGSASKSKNAAADDDDGSAVTLTNFPDYFSNYMKERFPWPTLRVEYVYNLLDTCKKNEADYVLGKFMGILEGRIDEAIIHAFRSDVAKVRNVLIAKSNEGGHTMGSLPASEFPNAMIEAFPNKSEDEIKNLVKAAAKQTGAVADWFLMKYVSFFVMTDEGLVGDFIQELTAQFHANRLEYIYEIINVLLSELGVSLQSAERENDPAGETDVTMPQIYSAITAVDPQLPEDRIAAILAWVLMGESSLPGLPPKGILLVRYIQEYIRRHPNAEADSDEDDDGDIAEFERALDEIKTKEDSMLDDGEGEAVDEKKRKAQLKRMKLLPLRVVLMRLKGGCMFRYGKKANVAKEKSGSVMAGEENPVKTKNSIKTKELEKKAQESVKRKSIGNGASRQKSGSHHKVK